MCVNGVGGVGVCVRVVRARVTRVSATRALAAGLNYLLLLWLFRRSTTQHPQDLSVL